MNLNNPIFSDEAKARAYFEAIRWPNGPFCPHCGETEKVYRLEGKSHRPGLIHCNSCNGAFTVTTGGVMESSHIPLTKWALGFRLYSASKKGFSAHELHRSLGITYKSAWFMAHRIREAMAPAEATTQMGGEGKVIEADELYLTKGPSERTVTRTTGKKMTSKHGRGTANKRVVVSLVERGGEVRSFHLKGSVTKANITELVTKHVHKASRLHTDESNLYGGAGEHVYKHERIHHAAGEYARGDVTTNSVEGVFGIFTRGMAGTYQHCGEQHLHRYLAEFDFRQSNRVALGVNDEVRTERAIKGAEGKRLTYHQTSGQEGAKV
jgi:transposase-like protein